MNTITKNALYFSMLAFGLFAGGCSEDDNITENTAVTSMSFAETGENNTVSLYPGDTWKSSIVLFPENASNKDEYAYRYTSSDENIFTVDETGTVTAIGEGEAVLTAWSTNNTDMWASCIIEVNKRIYSVTSIEVPEIYQSITTAVGVDINLGAEVKVLPETAWNTDVTYTSSDPSVAYVDNYGKITTKAEGNATITLTSEDGSGITATADIHVREIAGYTASDRTGWTVTASHQTATDDKAPEIIKGTPEALIDSDNNSCLTLVKPGKSWAIDNITVPADDIVYFIIDMGKEENFDYFCLRHRTYQNTNAMIRVNKVSVYGSNDGEAFTPISTDINIATNVDEVSVPLPIKQHYRYFKMTYDGWSSSGTTMQVSEFNIGNIAFAE